MYKFAFRNLRARPLRSVLSLVGMAVAIVLIMGLVSFSQGIRKLISESLGQVDGLVVLSKQNPDLLLSTIREERKEDLEKIEGARAAYPEVWHAAYTVDGVHIFQKRGMDAMDHTLILLGVDPAAAAEMERGALFQRAMREGRYLREGDERMAILSREKAKHFEKEVGDSINVSGVDLEIVGIFETGSLFFDMILVTDIGTVRDLKKLEKGFVSVYFVEAEAGEDLAVVERRIEDAYPEFEAQTPEEIHAYAGSWLERLDVFLLVITILPIVGGAVAILNTMLMSFGERIKEFGVMRACGWTRRDLVGLVLYESSYLGFAGGVFGVALGYLGVHLVGYALVIEPVTPAWLPISCLALSTILGMAGGTYPAAKAARMDPIRAIKYE